MRVVSRRHVLQPLDMFRDCLDVESQHLERDGWLVLGQALEMLIILYV